MQFFSTVYFSRLEVLVKYAENSLKASEIIKNDLCHDVRKPDFCICQNKDADQLRGNREADQRLCFRYTDSTITILPKSEISSP